MKKQLLALSVITATLFACEKKDNYSGRWIGNCMGNADTIVISKEGDHYNLVNRGQTMAAKMTHDTLYIDMGTSKVAFTFDKGQLTVSAGPLKCSYDKK